MRQGGEPQGVQIVRQGEPTPYHCNFNPLYFGFGIQKSSLHIDIHVQAAFEWYLHFGYGKSLYIFRFIAQAQMKAADVPLF